MVGYVCDRYENCMGSNSLLVEDRYIMHGLQYMYL